MSTQLVEVFLGDHIDDRNERRVLSSLRLELERRRIRARIYANFTAGREQRQVDLLICTQDRLVHAELKTVDPTLPLVGRANGPWAQLMPNGRERLLERNYFRQAHGATFAISDVMHDLARGGEVPARNGKFYVDIDTVICMWPNVPAGSRLGPYPHVEVIGYDDLVDLLATPGPRPNWTARHWDAFARHLGLYAEPTESGAEVARRGHLELLADYRRRYSAAHRVGLHELVPIAARTGGASVAHPVEVLTTAARAQHLVVFTGPSGAGKSHAAEHAALTIADAGGVPIWVRCREYGSGRFSVALARAVAPFTTEPWMPLLERVAEAGSLAVVVLDGLNECTPEARRELLEQLDALRLRFPVATIVTSTEPVMIPEGVGITHLRADLPDDAARAALLASHGNGQLVGAEAFSTALELALAAQCAEDLRRDAGTSDVFDAYIQRRCPTEAARAGLRLLASEMDVQLRRSLTVAEARSLLHRTAVGSAPGAGVDEVLQSPLLVHGQGRVAFSHELFARFLAAEHLVLGAPDTASLLDALGDPRHSDLREFAVALEHGTERQHDLLLALADVSLLRDAIRGRYGASAAACVRASVTAALAEARLATTSAGLARESGPDLLYAVQWRTALPRAAQEQALLQAAGACLRDGLFIEETSALLDTTDRRCLTEMGRLRAEGHRRAISALVEATYGFVEYSPEREAAKMPASVVLLACHHDRIESRWNADADEDAVATVSAMWNVSAAEPRWGSLTAVLLMVNADCGDDLALLPDLLRAAWAAGGYHLRLLALTLVTDNTGLVDDATRDRIRMNLEGFDTDGNLWLNSSLFEALAAYGALEPISTADDIRAEIAAVLGEPNSPDAWAAAQGIVGRLFEDEGVVGPYSEVVDELDDVQALRLYVMAARTDVMPFNHDWILRQIVRRLDHADDAAYAVVRDAAQTLDWDNPMAQEAVSAHLEALHGWAQLADHLPEPAATGGDLAQRAWRIVDELLFALLRGATPAADETDMMWSELLDLCAPAAVDVMDHLRRARNFSLTPDPTPYAQIVAAYPAQVRELFEWGVSHRDELVATLRGGPPDGRVGGLIHELGCLGTADTAALLRSYVLDPELGRAAVEAIRAIEERGHS